MTAPGPVTDSYNDMNHTDYGHPVASGFTRIWPTGRLPWRLLSSTTRAVTRYPATRLRFRWVVTLRVRLLCSEGGAYPTPSGYAAAKMAHTFSDGAKGGLWTPSTGGSAFTSSGVVAPAGGTTFTIKYTPSKAGSTALTFGNQQSCWVDPSPVQITVSSAAARIVGGRRERAVIGSSRCGRRNPGLWRGNARGGRRPRDSRDGAAGYN